MSEQDRPAGPQLAIQRVYLKDLSFESPKAPSVFRAAFKPNVQLDINSRYEQLDAALYEVVLSLTVTARNEQEEILYLVEVQQAGIFTLAGLEGDAMTHALGSFCPNVLFPYAREAIDAMIVKGSFPPLMLAPVNFDALLEQVKAQRAQEGTAH